MSLFSRDAGSFSAVHVLVVCDEWMGPTQELWGFLRQAQKAVLNEGTGKLRLVIAASRSRRWDFPSVEACVCVEADTCDQAVREALMLCGGEPVFFVWAGSEFKCTVSAFVRFVCSQGVGECVGVTVASTPGVGAGVGERGFRFEVAGRALLLADNPDFFLSVAEGVSFPRACDVEWCDGDFSVRGLSCVTRFFLKNPLVGVFFVPDVRVEQLPSEAPSRVWSDPSRLRVLVEVFIPQWRRLYEGRECLWCEHLIVYVVDRCAQFFELLSVEPDRAHVLTVEQLRAGLFDACRGIPAVAVEGFQAVALSRVRRAAIAAPGCRFRGEVAPPQPIAWARRTFRSGVKVSFLVVAGGDGAVPPGHAMLSETGFAELEGLAHGQWLSQGRVLEGTSQKIVTHGLFNNAGLYECIAWVNPLVDSLAFQGRIYEISRKTPHFHPPQPVFPIRAPKDAPGRIEESYAKTNRGSEGKGTLSFITLARLSRIGKTALIHTRKTIFNLAQQAADQLWATLGRAKQSQKEPDVWLYMDRADSTGDNAEPFYRYASTHAPDIQHYFALRQNSPDWERLSAQGFDLVDIDSEEFPQLWSKAKVLLLSDIGDRAIHHRLNSTQTRHDQHVIFLQHGYTPPGAYQWMNGKRIDTLVTSCAEEQHGIIRDGSGFVLTQAEVIATGFPRHDKLTQILDEAQKTLPNQARYVLLAPTWNYELTSFLEHHTILDTQRALDNFYKPWLALATQARKCGYQPVVFMHPKIAQHGHTWGEKISFPVCTGRALQEVLPQVSWVITDKSSVMLEAVLCGARGIIYDEDSTIHTVELHQDLHGFDIYYASSQAQVEQLLTGANPGAIRTRHPHIDGRACERLLDFLRRTCSKGEEI